MYYVKNSFIIVLYLLFSIATALAIQLIGIVWLEEFLHLLNLALFTFITFFLSAKLGEEAARLKHSNDSQRRFALENEGYLTELNEKDEYKPYKGFIIGLIVTVPLVLGLLVQAVFDIAGTGNVIPGVISELVYSVFSVIYSTFSDSLSPFISLYAVPFCMAVTGLAYLKGAAKVNRQYERIRKTHNEIYGKKN